MKKILSILILLLSNVAVAQHVTDVDAYQLGDKIIVEYAISGPENPSSGGRYSVVPSFSVDGGINYTALKSISGDLSNVNVGRGKRIEWRVLDEYDSFVHPEVIFKVDIYGGGSGTADVQERKAESSAIDKSPSTLESGEDYYRKGQECEKNKRYADAIKYYRQASQKGYKQADERIKALQLQFW